MSESFPGKVKDRLQKIEFLPLILRGRTRQVCALACSLGDALLLSASVDGCGEKTLPSELKVILKFLATDFDLRNTSEQVRDAVKSGKLCSAGVRDNSVAEEIGIELFYLN